MNILERNCGRLAFAGFIAAGAAAFSLWAALAACILLPAACIRAGSRALDARLSMNAGRLAVSTGAALIAAAVLAASAGMAMLLVRTAQAVLGG